MVRIAKIFFVLILLASGGANACTMYWEMTGQDAFADDPYGDCSCGGRLLAQRVLWRACYQEANRLTAIEEAIRNNPPEKKGPTPAHTAHKDVFQNTGAPFNPVLTVR